MPGWKGQHLAEAAPCLWPVPTQSAEGIPAGCWPGTQDSALPVPAGGQARVHTGERSVDTGRVSKWSQLGVETEQSGEGLGSFWATCQHLPLTPAHTDMYL